LCFVSNLEKEVAAVADHVYILLLPPVAGILEALLVSFVDQRRNCHTCKVY
jgi:hypothetical protein